MDCEWVGLLMMDYLDGACVDPLREKIESHLGACERCRAERDAMAAVDARLAGAVVPEPPAGIAEGATRGIERPAMPASRWRDLRPLAAAAAFLAAVVGAHGFLRDSVPAPFSAERIAAELAGLASRTGEGLVGPVVDFARDRLKPETK